MKYKVASRVHDVEKEWPIIDISDHCTTQMAHVDLVDKFLSRVMYWSSEMWKLDHDIFVEISTEIKSDVFLRRWSSRRSNYHFGSRNVNKTVWEGQSTGSLIWSPSHLYIR